MAVRSEAGMVGAAKLKIFISYSRRDAIAADLIAEALKARNFEVTIDRRDLPFGEKWQAEFAEFIRLSDTVVWLVSEASIQSKWVNWELDEVAKRNKRLVPLMVAPVKPDELPRQLGEIHILPPDRVFNLACDFDTLVAVLETDRAWLKHASRLQDRAIEWLAKGRSSALLLSRGAVGDAERWKEGRPTKAPAPAPEVLDLLLASRQSANRWQRRLMGGSLALALGALGLAGFAWWQSLEAERQRGVAVEQRRVTDIVRNEAQTTESGLLSEAAKEVLNLPGDSGAPLAMLLSLEGMPDQASDDPRRAQRERVPEVQVQLHAAYIANRERLVVAHADLVSTLAWSPDGRRLATGSAFGPARVVEAATGREVARISHESRVNAVTWSPDSRLLATASSAPGTKRT